MKRSLFYILIVVTMILSSCAAPTPVSPPAVVAPTKAAPPAAAPTQAAPTQAPAAATATTEPTAQPTPVVVEEKPAAYTQAPMLEAKVSSGALPPVAERLPVTPFVVAPGVYMTKENLPDWQPGKYGGTLRSAHSVANWAPDIFVAMDEPFLMAPKISDQGIVCNVCESFEVSDGNKVFTFKMRKNLKWSDGQPVTTEDVRFAWEDIRNNPKLYPSGPDNQWRTGMSPSGNPAKVDIIDDYNFKVTFDGPYGAFLRALTIEGWVGYTLVLEPAHYLKQFHIKYTTLEKLKPELDKLNLKDEWWQVFAAKRCQNWDMTNPRCVNYPALNPWIGIPTGNPSVLKFERNPYYYKVDTQGQQLPYIDYLSSQQMNDVEMVNMKVLSGDVDYLRESTALVKMPLYKASADKAGYRIILNDQHVDSLGLRFNETFNDPNWQKLSRDIRFRKAVSMAINRQNVIDTLYYGYASMPEKTMGPENMKYDVAAANALLDEIGITQKDADGFRKYWDGKPLTILIEHAAYLVEHGPGAEMVAQDLKKVGLNVLVKQIDSNLFGEKWAANQIQAAMHNSHDIGWSNDITSGNVDRAGVLWSQWLNTNGKKGEEPPDWAKQAYAIDAAKWAAVAGSPEYNAKVEEGFQWYRDNLPIINLVEFIKCPLIANVHLKNVATNGYIIGSNFSVVQMFFDNQ